MTDPPGIGDDGRMSSAAAAVSRAWARLCPHDDAVTTAVLADLQARWSEPHRRYHNLTHLAEVLRVLRRLPRGDSAAVRLAALFHDAVYRPEVAGTANEEASAVLLERLAPRCGFARATVTEAARLVRLTATHDPEAADLNGAALCDADLAILAAAPTRYLDYAGGIRAEYAHLDAATFAFGRIAVLRGLLSRQPLFATDYGRREFEQRARNSMAAELSMLTNSEDAQ
jgi:predicted metal-dependent HD superfamily phosphohydrolase